MLTTTQLSESTFIITQHRFLECLRFPALMPTYAAAALGATCQGGQELNEFTIYNKYDSMIVGSTTIYPLDYIEHISRTIQQKIEPWHRALE